MAKGDLSYSLSLSLSLSPSLSRNWVPGPLVAAEDMRAWPRCDAFSDGVEWQGGREKDYSLAFGSFGKIEEFCVG